MLACRISAANSIPRSASFRPLDRALRSDGEPRNPNHHRVILALSTAFWDAYLQDNKDALAWLNGTGPRSVMEPADDWKASPEK